MAAHSFLRLGRRYFYAVREAYPAALAAVFQDNERRETLGPTEDDDVTIEFIVPARVMRERLDVLGYTLARADTAVSHACAEDDTSLDRAHFDEWVTAMVVPVPEEEEWPEQLGEPQVWADGRLIARLLLEAAPDDLEFALDITRPGRVGPRRRTREPVRGGVRCRARRGRRLRRAGGAHRGSTDAEFLAGALEVQRPHLAPYIRFLDYYSNRPEGGAPALVRAVKAFAAALIGNRVVALFDNDTAAAEALSTLDVTALPATVRVMQLPPLAIAESYPTLGPTGPTAWDINGSACALELYLGINVLTGSDGTLMPVQWTGYAARLARYQGELLDKRAVHKRFRRKLVAARSAGSAATGDWSALNAVLDQIVRAH